MNRPIHEHFKDEFDNISLSLFENYLDDHDNTVYMHYHNRLEIIHVLEGEGVVSVNLKEYNITAGDIVLIAPNEIHSVKGKKDIILHCQTIVFQSDALDFEKDYSLQTCIEKSMPGNQNFCTLHSLIFNIHSTGFHEAYNVINGILLSLCGLITYHHYYFLAPTNTSSPALALKDVLKYMRENYTNKIEIATLAEIAGYSKYHFIRFFSYSTGYTCIQYLHILRLQKAKNLLRNTDYKLEHISKLSGFESVSYFIRIFKRDEGITPLQYRKQDVTHLHLK